MKFAEVKAGSASYSGGVVNSLHTSAYSVTLSDDSQAAVDVVLQTQTLNASPLLYCVAKNGHILCIPRILVTLANVDQF